mmetsp:Transcript_45481/g.90056  ORF Transcript_45481/g.90056 Transcript_45481/m.90056 type:complete len:603 (-) Transcript_45481:179-1987(-)
MHVAFTSNEVHEVPGNNNNIPSWDSAGGDTHNLSTWNLYAEDTPDHREILRRARSLSRSRTPREEERARTLQVDRYQRCWSCLINLCCPAQRRSWKDVSSRWFRRRFRNLTDNDDHQNNDLQEAVVSHLAVMTAEYLQHSPGLCSWLRGMILLRRSLVQEDEDQFAQCAPEPRSWPDLHYAVNLGVEAPCAQNGNQVPLQDVARAAAHFAKFQLAAYSMKMYAVMYPVSTCLTACCLSEKRAFQHMSGVGLGDILYVQLQARPFKPAWWLCRDPQSDTIVIAVRGTFTAADVLSDAFARQVQYQGHIVHEGVLASAKWLHRIVRHKLERLQDQDRSKKVVVTGHSLGGAVAALVAWMLREKCEDQGRSCFEALCFVYGAPLIVDWGLALKMQRFVVGIVNHMDMIPRTGLKSLEDLRDRVAELTLPRAERRLRQLEAVLNESGLPTDPDQLRQRLLNTAPADGPVQEGTFERYTSSEFHDAEEGDVCDLPNLVMFNPGWQLHLNRRGITSRCTEAWPILRKGMMRHFLVAASSPSPQYMHVVRPSLSMWTDHWPQAYLYVCEAFSDRLEAQNGGNNGATSSGELALSQVLRRVADYFDPSGV